jgi:hypothetical protein
MAQFASRREVTQTPLVSDEHVARIFSLGSSAGRPPWRFASGTALEQGVACSEKENTRQKNNKR